MFFQNPLPETNFRVSKRQPMPQLLLKSITLARSPADPVHSLRGNDAPPPEFRDALVSLLQGADPLARGPHPHPTPKGPGTQGQGAKRDQGNQRDPRGAKGPKGAFGALWGMGPWGPLGLFRSHSKCKVISSGRLLRKESR